MPFRKRLEFLDAKGLGGIPLLVLTPFPIIMVQWKIANYLKGNDPIGDTPIRDFHDYGRKWK